jgi:hypothetical protein
MPLTSAQKRGLRTWAAGKRALAALSTDTRAARMHRHELQCVVHLHNGDATKAAAALRKYRESSVALLDDVMSGATAGRACVVLGRAMEVVHSDGGVPCDESARLMGANMKKKYELRAAAGAAGAPRGCVIAGGRSAGCVCVLRAAAGTRLQG